MWQKQEKKKKRFGICAILWYFNLSIIKFANKIDYMKLKVSSF